MAEKLAGPGPHSGDACLVEGCLRGDERAWAALIDRYERLVYSIPIKYGASPEDAADIFQAVCLELFHDLPRLRNRDNLRPWLMTVAAHQSFHWKRRQRREREGRREARAGEGREEPTLPPALAAEVEHEQAVREAVGRLSARCRQMVQLLFFEQPPRAYAEVARRLGLATGSIGFIRARCLKHLQRALEELGF
jgi:RNA polymerase sigma factor (sigma-70 family)